MKFRPSLNRLAGIALWAAVARIGAGSVDTVFDDIPYVSAGFLDSLFGAKESWRPQTRQLQLRDREGREWIFTQDNPFVSIGGEMFNLTYPLHREAERCYLPRPPLLRLLRVRFGIDLHSPSTPRKKTDSAAELKTDEKLLPAPDSAPNPVKRGPSVIIVDAGHGGSDRGAVVKDVEEGVVNLAVAKELKKALEDLGYKALLTRTEDEFKTLEERPKFASDSGGEVFVSLHCNSLAGPINRHKNVTGSTVYILREGESEEDKALARRENQAILEESGKSGKTEIAPVDWILMEHQLNLYSKQSESLAEIIVKDFEGFDIPKYSTGAHQAGFFVLVGAYMPAVLFEMGFLTNDHDRRILSSPSGQKGIAKRMAKAVDRFKKLKNLP